MVLQLTMKGFSGQENGRNLPVGMVGGIEFGWRGDWCINMALNLCFQDSFFSSIQTSEAFLLFYTTPPPLPPATAEYTNTTTTTTTIQNAYPIPHPPHELLPALLPIAQIHRVHQL